MKIQPIAYQPNFSGKVRCMDCIGVYKELTITPKKIKNNKIVDLPATTWERLNKMVENEPFDVFIHPNKKNEEFFNVDAGKSFDDVLKGIQGKVKVRYDALEALPLAIKDAVRNFEENIKEKRI